MITPTRKTLEEQYKSETGQEAREDVWFEYQPAFVNWLSGELTNETNALHACEETLARVSNEREGFRLEVKRLEACIHEMIWLYLAGGVLLVLLLIAGEIFKVTP